MTSKPIIRKINDNRDALDSFEKDCLQNEDEKTQDIILNYPTVYIHNWKNTDDYEVYVGESNGIIKRTRQHFEYANNPDNWQNVLLKRDACLYIIAHDHFNKSMTLDIESRLMHYLMSSDHVKQVHNLRDNPQTHYYPVDELDEIFNKIWRELRKQNCILFPSESKIKDSAIFKASPLHKLTKEQEDAKELIIQKISDALINGDRGQLIFIEGEAGTGKTVLNSSTFYDMYCQAEKNKKPIDCHLLVNHDEQITVYKQIVDKLGLNKYGDIVSKPTSFINNHSIDNPVDVAFIDEAHLLLTQGKQSYTGNNQLKDIIDRSRVVVVMFDENQILTTEQFWEVQILEQYRKYAKQNNNYIELKKQLRMQAEPEIIEWIDAFTKKCELKKIPSRTCDYSIKIFNSPETLDNEIQKKAKDERTALSRIIATYDWEYSNKHNTSDRLGKYWEVVIGSWHKPWNRELESDLSSNQKKKIRGLSWAEQPQTINEVGSTFTIQGFDLNYAGVILGPSVKYRNGKILFDPNNSYNKKATRNRSLSDGTKEKFGEQLLSHEIRVLMTRGVNGLYIYACDDELREALLRAVE